MTENMLTLKEVAQELRMSRSSAQRLVRGEVKDCPKLPAVIIGGRVLVRRDTLETFIRSLEHTAPGVQSPA